MLGERLRRFRTAQGLSLAALADRMDHVVTRQALSKYENGKAQPSPSTLVALARALGVRASELSVEPRFALEVHAFRKLAALSKRESDRLESTVVVELERRIGFMESLGLPIEVDLEPDALEVDSLEDAERAADAMREEWGLGGDPIANLTETLEDRRVHVIDVAADRGFDGLCAIARDEDGRSRAVAIAVRSDTAGGRYRLDLAHELGHVVQRAGEDVDEEKAAFRFGGAFLAPAEALLEEVGERRTSIEPVELLALKRKWGMSAQALLYRLRDLGVIPESHYKEWCVRMNVWRWRVSEPAELEPERSTWMERKASRAVAEGVIAREEVGRYLPSARPAVADPRFDRRALMRLPVEERRAVLEEQAAVLREYYADGDVEWQAGDFEGD